MTIANWSQGARAIPRYFTWKDKKKSQLNHNKTVHQGACQNQSADLIEGLEPFWVLIPATAPNERIKIFD